jgi:hypothetical protein
LGIQKWTRSGKLIKEKNLGIKETSQLIEPILLQKHLHSLGVEALVGLKITTRRKRKQML